MDEVNAITLMERRISPFTSKNQIGAAESRDKNKNEMVGC